MGYNERSPLGARAGIHVRLHGVRSGMMGAVLLIVFGTLLFLESLNFSNARLRHPNEEGGPGPSQQSLELGIVCQLIDGARIEYQEGSGHVRFSPIAMLTSLSQSSRIHVDG
jgi:hypothetical protein